MQALTQGDVSLVFPVTNGLFILFTITGSVLLFDEPVMWGIVAGGVLILSGIALVSISSDTQGDSGKTGGGSKRLSAFGLGSTMVVLDSTSSVFAAMLSVLYIHERITSRVALGIALSLDGIVLSLA